MMEEQGGKHRGQGEKRRHEIKMSEGLGIFRMQWGGDELKLFPQTVKEEEGAAVMKLECSCSPLCTEPHIPQIFMHQAK